MDTDVKNGMKENWEMRAALVRRLRACIIAIPADGFPNCDTLGEVEMEAEALVDVDNALTGLETALGL